ncbi:MAG: sugar ABC transporter permease [Limnochordia bacterium]|jgi:putative multiple sugar transport system permease protein|nr:sugar ABC transporter permease [Limnochordia bacterium]MDI9464731.1 sugar ABC transporter permease [Bacillota bacterium]
MNTAKVNETAVRGSLGAEIRSLLISNIRDYAMYVALAVIFVVFTIATDRLFISPRNLVNLVNQTGYVAVLAIGMTLILIIRHIDLSVGFVAGFLGAVAAILLMKGWNVWLVVPIVLLCGVAVGVYQGLLVTRIKVPAFVTTLAGMFMFRGLLSWVTAGTGTIIVRDQTFLQFSNGYIPDLPWGQNVNFHLLTLLLGIAMVAAVVWGQVKQRQDLKRYNFPTVSPVIFGGKLVFFAVVILAVTWIMASYRGLPWTAVIVAAVLLIYNFILNKTRLGRHIYAIGGNPEAAELSGIKVRNVTFLVFASMGLMSALAGILYTSRLASATPTAGLGFELDAIASSYIGGVSVGGGVGRVTNTIVGALVIMSLTNGMNLLGVDISFQYVVKGAIFVLAVAFDVITRSRARV